MNKQVTKLREIRTVTSNKTALDAGDVFYTDFSDLRGSFKKNRLFRTLNIDPKDYSCLSETENQEPILVFIAGMRGAGKSTELRKIEQELQQNNAYFCVHCDIDKELDTPTLDYAEILVYQLKKLNERLWETNIKPKDGSVDDFERWFREKLKALSERLSLPLPEQVGWMKLEELLKLIHQSMTEGDLENTGKFRAEFNQNFSELAGRFNAFVREATLALRAAGKAREVLFIIDGLEKTQTANARRRVLVDDRNRIRQIRANMLFTLPIELMQDSKGIREDAEVLSFPFIKVVEADNSPVEPAIERFQTFIYKRITPQLFESESVVREFILFSGGSPRELLRLLDNAYLQMEPDEVLITSRALHAAVHFLSSDAKSLSPRELDILKEIKKYKGVNVPNLEGMQRLLEQVYIMEYNDGNYKRVNPIIESSAIYRHHVGEAG